MSVSVQPHDFAPLKRSILRRRETRCSACYRTPEEHPTTSWQAARAYGDGQPSRKLSVFFCGNCTTGDRRCVSVGCPGFKS